MNKTNIEWTDFTWNPVTGCLHGCSYCYARKIATRFNGTKAFPNGFQPAYHPNRLLEPRRVKKPSKIFVCSMADLFGEWVPDAWIWSVLEIVRCCPQHIFQFLTKNPSRLRNFNPWPENAWVGATTSNQKEYEEAIEWLPKVEAAVRFISAEPLLFNPQNVHRFLDWIIIGAQTGPGAVAPDPKWIYRLTFMAKCFDIPIFNKDNLEITDGLKEFPKPAKEKANEVQTIKKTGA